MYISHLIPRKDIGSFIYSRSESVNYWLCSLCSQNPDISFIDLRQTLHSRRFSGLVFGTGIAMQMECHSKYMMMLDADDTANQ